MNRDEASQYQSQYAQYQHDSAPQERDLVRLRQRIAKHRDDIDELCARVRVLADQIYGHEPAPPPTPGAGAKVSQLEPPLLQGLESAIGSVDDALGSLASQLARLSSL